jgi:hypothetical protein
MHVIISLDGTDGELSTRKYEERHATDAALTKAFDCPKIQS